MLVHRFSNVALLVLACIGAACNRSESTESAGPPIPPAPAGVQQTKIVVGPKGFTPNEVSVEKGKPAWLVFVRTSDDTCAQQVAIPELNLKKDLPLNTPVKIEVPTGEPKTLTFQCGMGMYKSSVVVK